MLRAKERNKKQTFLSSGKIQSRVLGIALKTTFHGFVLHSTLMKLKERIFADFLIVKNKRTYIYILVVLF